MSDSPVAPPDPWTNVQTGDVRVVGDAYLEWTWYPPKSEFVRGDYVRVEDVDRMLATERQSHAAQLAEKDATLRSHIDVIKNQGEALRDEVTTRCKAEASLTAARAEIARLTEELARYKPSSPTTIGGTTC